LQAASFFAHIFLTLSAYPKPQQRQPQCVLVFSDKQREQACATFASQKKFGGYAKKIIGDNAGFFPCRRRFFT
jgi:hypothetical protein